jgi:hypothetical protein
MMKKEAIDLENARVQQELSDQGTTENFAREFC